MSKGGALHIVKVFLFSDDQTSSSEVAATLRASGVTVHMLPSLDTALIAQSAKDVAVGVCTVKSVTAALLRFVRSARAAHGTVRIVAAVFDELPEAARDELTAAAGVHLVWPATPSSAVNAALVIARELTATHRETSGGVHLLLHPFESRVLCYTLAGRPLSADLTPQELRFLRALLERFEDVVPFPSLDVVVWGGSDPGDRTKLARLKHNVNEKLQAIGAGVQVQAVRGQGYMLSESGAQSSTQRRDRAGGRP